MKIRMNGNSVRLRLTQSDVRNLGREGYVQEETHFGSSTFCYRLQQSNTINDLSAGFSSGKITVYIPADFVQTLESTDRIGYDAYHPIGENKTLLLLVEKDFKCVDHTLEDQTDMYLNPNKTC